MCLTPSLKRLLEFSNNFLKTSFILDGKLNAIEMTHPNLDSVIFITFLNETHLRTGEYLKIRQPSHDESIQAICKAIRFPSDYHFLSKPLLN